MGALGRRVGRHRRRLPGDAARRVGGAARGQARRRRDTLAEDALPIAQTALAAALAWLAATELAGHERPFFAPIAATLVTGLALGARGRRALEVIAGVTIGIVVGDLLLRVTGTGAVAIAVFVVAAMVVAVLLGATPLVVGQAATSAVLVAALPPPSGDFDFARALDAAIGGAVAFAVHALLPVDPVARARRAAEPLLGELVVVLREVADALAERSEERAEAALDHARAIDAEVDRFRERVGEGRETARVALPRRGALMPLEGLAVAADQLDLAVRDVRVLARGVLRALALEDRVPGEVPEAVRDLAGSVAAIADELRGDTGARDRAIDAAVRAAARATHVLESTANLSVSVLVGQIRATAVDLLASLGVEQDEARRAVREAASAVTPAGSPAGPAAPRR